MRFHQSIPVRYADTDAQGHVFFANYLTFFDEAVTGYCDTIGFGYDAIRAAGADFVYVDVSPAGAVYRPDVTTRLRDIDRSLAFEMVRVLDDEHAAVGPWDPHLDEHDLQVGLRHMLLTRLFDERMHRMQRQGKISFYMKSLGEEAVSVAATHALAPGDMLFPSYRQQGLQFARGRSPTDLMLTDGLFIANLIAWGAAVVFLVYQT